MNSVPQMFELALQHHRGGNLHQAELLYRQILELDPRHADALHLLGVIAHQVGRNDLAVDYIEQALRLQPNFPAAYNNLGMALMKQGKLAEAQASFQQVLRLVPDHPEARVNLGNVLLDQGKIAEAIANYQHALRLRPDDANAHNNLGNLLKEQGNLDEAITCYQQALRLEPDLATAHNNLGTALVEQAMIEEAISCCRQALRLKPDFAEAYNNLGNALKVQGKFDEAIASYRQALRLKPDLAEAYMNLGNALQSQEKLEEAIANYEQAVRLKPDYAEAYNNLGMALKDQGKIDEAISAYRTAMRLNPDRALFHSNLVYILPFHPQYDAATILQECRHWNQRHAEPLAKLIQPHANDRSLNRRLRIGYVSPDFRAHPVASFTIPLLEHHDHQQFAIYCYANVARPDALTERHRSCADVWRSTVGVSDQRVADLVRSDQIDVLVDLTMHMANSRLLVFARKPAPVQVTWLAYAGTTGLAAMDYRLTDPYLDPPGENDRCYSEQSIHLPETFWCYDPLTDELPINALPALQNGCVTFACLNNFAKVNEGVLALWSMVLQSVPHSRLLLVAPRGSAREHVCARFQAAGIAGERVQFLDKQSKLDYFQAFNRVDLCLDPWPYNGGTTSLDGLWMGVPMITMVCKTVLGRAGWSLLYNLGLQELAAQTPQEYFALAVQLAGDLPRLQELRATLRGRLCASPLMDARRFACHMEQAYRRMWGNWVLKSR